MNMKKRLMDDLKVAMKEKQKLRKAVITMLRSAIKQIEVDERVEVPEERVMDIIASQIKTKRKAIEDFKKAERQDLVDEALEEIRILQEYLPKQLSVTEIEKIVEEAIEAVGASSMKDMGKVMGIVNAKVKGIAEGSVVAKIVKEKLM
ncbi:GatB/YqeY domain-containing protein [Clostridiaceae bacterium HSG29]|nr:GatB/YqeY domain-containing protein [Clostridiaceae bacterium HSG29]